MITHRQVAEVNLKQEQRTPGTRSIKRVMVQHCDGGSGLLVGETVFLTEARLADVSQINNNLKGMREERMPNLGMGFPFNVIYVHGLCTDTSLGPYYVTG